MSEFESKKGQEFKVDDVFFKDNFDITDIEDNIYNQMAKTIARNVDIELAKTPLVDILTGYTRYKEAEYELQQKDKEIERLNNIIDKAKEKSIYLQERYGYILDDLTFMLMQGSDK